MNLLAFFKQQIINPIFFLALLIFPLFFYFTNLEYWWLYQLFSQFLICLVGFFLYSWRLPAIIFMSLLAFYSYNWISMYPIAKNSCSDSVSYLTGISKLNSWESVNNLLLIKGTIKCGQKTISKAMIRIDVSSYDFTKNRWFRRGDKLKITGLKQQESGQFFMLLKDLPNFKIINISQAAKIFQRTALLLFIQKKAEYYLDAFPTSIYLALMTADKSKLKTDWKKTSQDLGIAHLFAISGLHIGIIYLWLALFFKIILTWPLSFIKGNYGLLIIDILSLSLVYLFLILIGTPISAHRAFIMLAWWLVIRHFLAWQPLWFILLGTALLITLDSPLAIGQISFQLSFVSVAGIVMIYKILPQNKFFDGKVKKTLKLMASLALISLWLSLLILPIVQQFYLYFSLLSFFNNVIHIIFLSWLYLPIALASLSLLICEFYLGSFFSSFYLFSLLNFMGHMWRAIFELNHQINQFFLFKIDFDWGFYTLVLYWSSLMSILFILKKRLLFSNSVKNHVTR